MDDKDEEWGMDAEEGESIKDETIKEILDGIDPEEETKQ